MPTLTPAQTAAMLDNIGTIASLAPGHSDDITTSIEKRSAAQRHQAAGAPAQASADTNYLNNRDSLDEQLTAAIREANNKVQSDGDKKKLAGAVAGLLGIGADQADAVLTDLRNKEHANKDGTTAIGRFFGSKTEAGHQEDTIYAQIGAALKPATDATIEGLASLQKDTPFAADLVASKKPQPTLTDPELLSQLGDATRTLPPAARDAITLIATAEPDHAKDIIKKTRAFTEDMAEHGGAPSAARAGDLAKSLTEAAVDYAKSHGGADATVANALGTITGQQNSLATITAAAFGSKEAAHAGRAPMNDNEGPEDSANAARRAEGQRLQRDNEAALVAQLTEGLTHPRAVTAAAAAGAGVAATAAAAAATAAAPEAHPVPERTSGTAVPPAQELHSHQFRHDGKTEKVTEIAVEGGAPMKAEELQRALKAANQNIGTFGPRGDGVDNDAGDKTVAALRAYRERTGSKHKNDKTLVIHADEVESLKKLAAQYNAPAGHSHGRHAENSGTAVPIEATLAHNINPEFIKATFKAATDPKAPGSDSDKALAFMRANGNAQGKEITGADFNVALGAAITKYDKAHPGNKGVSVEEKIAELSGQHNVTMKKEAHAASTAVAQHHDEQHPTHTAAAHVKAGPTNGLTISAELAGINPQALKDVVKATGGSKAGETLDTADFNERVTRLNAAYAAKHNGETKPFNEEAAALLGTKVASIVPGQQETTVAKADTKHPAKAAPTAPQQPVDHTLRIDNTLAGMDPKYLQGMLEASAGVTAATRDGVAPSDMVKALQASLGKEQTGVLGVAEFEAAAKRADVAYAAGHPNSNVSAETKIAALTGGGTGATVVAVNGKQSDNLSTEARLELLASVSGDQTALQGGTNARKAVAAFQESHHIETDRKGTMTPETMTAMIDEYAKKNHIDMAAVTARLESEAATHVAARTTPTRVASAQNARGNG